jgi:hypothetical protein
VSLLGDSRLDERLDIDHSYLDRLAREQLDSLTGLAVRWFHSTHTVELRLIRDLELHAMSGLCFDGLFFNRNASDS